LGTPAKDQHGLLGALIRPIFNAEHLAQARAGSQKPRCNKEVGRRTDVVGIFPNDRSLIHLAGMLCIEQNGEWLVGRGYLAAESTTLGLRSISDGCAPPG
jgi:hypothetical protein